jgi:uncharacterized protein (AIM24 family)
MTRSVAVMSGLRSDVLALLRPTAGGGAMAFARGVAATLATRLAGIDVAVFTLTVTPRLLGAEGRGQFAVTMEAVFGDASRNSPTSGGGLMGSLLSAGKRLVTGESLFTTVFTHGGPSGKAHVAFAAPFPGTVMAMKLSDHNGRLICQKDSFLAGARGVSLGIFLQRKILTGLFGGEGMFFATLTGPGKVWLQSLPFSRMAGRMLAAAPKGGGKSRGEGSVLGGLGNLLDGDSNF